MTISSSPSLKDNSPGIVAVRAATIVTAYAADGARQAAGGGGAAAECERKLPRGELKPAADTRCKHQAAARIRTVVTCNSPCADCSCCCICSIIGACTAATIAASAAVSMPPPEAAAGGATCVREKRAVPGGGSFSLVTSWCVGQSGPLSTSSSGGGMVSTLGHFTVEKVAPSAQRRNRSSGRSAAAGVHFRRW